MEADLPKHHFAVKDLPTKSVTLYPSLARVVRDVGTITLVKPGSAIVEIEGLTPTVDENSIQIEGQGQAIITDLTVDLVPNKEIFEHVYAEDDYDDDDGSDESDDEEHRQDEEETEDAKTLNLELKKLRFEFAEAEEVHRTSQSQLQIMDQYCNTVKADCYTQSNLFELLATYETQRLDQWARRNRATERGAELSKQITRCENRLRAVERESRKKKEIELKQREKERKIKAREQAEARKERARVKAERLSFWPKKYYKVTLYLESLSDTPQSSRRSSIDSLTLTHGHSPKLDDAKFTQQSAPKTVSLSLSYVTREAYWYPRYDVSISSITKTAKITYRAEFVNATSETWRNAKISLSTSQASYTGLEDTLPRLDTWHIRLSKSNDRNGGLLSKQESQKVKIRQFLLNKVNRDDLFGAPLEPPSMLGKKQASSLLQYQKQLMQLEQNSTKRMMMARQEPVELFKSVRAPAAPQMAQAQQMPQMPQVARGGAMPQQLMQMGGVMNGARFGGLGPQVYQPQSNHTVDGQGTGIAGFAGFAPGGSTQDDHDSGGADMLTQLDFEESGWEDTGMTTTYDVPSPRTLTPSSLPRRHKIATLQAQGLQFSHIAVPKLRAAVFLRTKGRNPSASVTLLRGTAGVTLDEAFLGTMQLPRIGPGQPFDLPLGIDPGLPVSYSVPTVKRSTTGMFTKESAAMYSRSIFVTNTKAAPVEVRILDQVPVSEDDKLTVDILQPRGLKAAGDTVKAGVSAKEGSAAQGKPWGRGTATLKKDGKIEWDLTIEKGQACVLNLDYEARLPASGGTIMTASGQE